MILLSQQGERTEPEAQVVALPGLEDRGEDGPGEGRGGVPAVGLCSQMREPPLLTRVNIQGVTEP